MLMNIQNLASGYNGAAITHDINLTVEPGQCIAILGPNGAGKSTLLRTIAGQVDVKAGQIDFERRNITKTAAYQRPRAGLCLVPEGRHVFAGQSVIDNLKLSATYSGHGASFEANKTKVFELFPRLAERANQLAGTMSGGEQQMLAIGRALMMQPKLLMLDEPSLGLAPKLVDIVFDALKTLNSQGLALIVVEQFAHRALSLTAASPVPGQVYVLNHGEIVDSAAPTELTDERLHAAYLK